MSDYDYRDPFDLSADLGGTTSLPDEPSGAPNVVTNEEEEEAQEQLSLAERARRFEARAASPMGQIALRNSATTSGPRLDAPLGMEEEEEEEPGSFGERARDTAMGGIRLLASGLEPIQLSQDVFFATIEAGLDDDKTLLENLKEIEWAKYAPFGAMPARVTDGETILGLAGVEDERTRKWGGIAMDLVVDPLIFGSVARVAGKASKIDGLVNLGDRMDQAVAPEFWARSVYRSSPQVKASVDNLTEKTLNAIRNPANPMSGPLTRAIDATVARRSAARLKLGGLAPEARQGAGNLPEEFVRSEQLGAQRATELVEGAHLEMQELRAMLGDDGLAESKARRVLQNLGLIRRQERLLRNVPTIVRESAIREMYDYIGNHPAALTPEVGFTDDVRDMLSMGDDAFRPAFELGEDLAGGARLLADSEGGLIRESQNAFEEAVERVRRVAVENGYEQGAEKFVQNFREATGRAAALNARIGYELSGTRLAQEALTTRAAEVFGDTQRAVDLWGEVRRAGVHGNLERWLDTASGISPKNARGLTAKGLRQAQDRRRAYDRAYEANTRRGRSEDEARAAAERARDSMPEPEIDDGLGRAVDNLRSERAARDAAEEGPIRDPNRDFTWREVLGDEWGGFSSLDVGTYLSGLRNGHMYRSYGIWQTQDQFQDWVRKIEEGVIVPNNIIDENHVRGWMEQQDMADEASAVFDYINAISKRGGTARGTTINTRKLARHVAERLETQGLEKKAAGARAARVIEELGNATRNKRVEKAREIREQVLPSFQQQEAERLTPLVQGRFTEREDLDQDALDALGEMANPFVSMAEDANALRSRLPAMEFMKGVYDEGVASGAVRKQPFTDPETGVVFQKVKDGRNIAGPFDGKYVHPKLMEEVYKAAGRRDYTTTRLGHLRSLLTGGYLASPNVLTANVAGGLLSSWEAGIPPHRMLKAMTETWGPLHKDGGRDYQLFRELREREPVGLQAVSMQDVQQNFRDFKLSESALQPGGLRQAGQEIGNFYEWILQGGPRQTRWAGLAGFQFTETWMKTAAYKAARDMGKHRNEAAELARTAVFDYSELPDALRFGRDYGVLMFPGFPYFMTARTIRSVFERPAVPAMADRAAGAVSSAFMDVEERLAAWANMPDWLKQDQGVPIAMWEDDAENQRASFIPMNQILPTSTFAGNPYAESLATGGLWSPLIEALYAHVEGSGDAVFSQRYGQQVFEPSQDPAERARATLSFMFNNFAPSNLRKLYSPQAGSDPTGLLPQLVMEPEAVRGIYTFEETNRNRAQRDLKDTIIGSLLRSPRQIALEGPLIGIRNERANAEREHNAKLSAIREDIDRARARRDHEEADRLTARMHRMDAEFKETWRTRMQLARQADWD